MQDQFYTFSMFDAQAWLARDYVLGRIKLPSRARMEKETAAWVAREEALKNATEMIDFQTDYMKDLVKDIDYPDVDLDECAAMFKEWEHHKGESILDYRNHAFASPVTERRRRCITRNGSRRWTIRWRALAQGNDGERMAASAQMQRLGQPPGRTGPTHALRSGGARCARGGRGERRSVKGPRELLRECREAFPPTESRC